MKKIPKNEFATIADMCASKLYTEVRAFTTELERLHHKGNSFNYEEVLFLCYKFGVDVQEAYPQEDRAMLLSEQERIMTKIYGNERTLW